MAAERVPVLGPLLHVLLGLGGELVLDDERELQRESARPEHGEHEAPLAGASLGEVEIESIDDRQELQRRAVQIELAVGRARELAENEIVHRRASAHRKAVDGLIGEPGAQHLFDDLRGIARGRRKVLHELAEGPRAGAGIARVAVERGANRDRRPRPDRE